METLQDVLAPTVIDIWSSILALDAVELPAETTPDTSPAVVSTVHLAGATSGAVVINCAEPLARLVAATMFNVALDEVTAADIHDAVGELTNIAAGNLKAALPNPYLLSLPTVVEGQDFRTHLPNGRLVAQTAFSCGDHRFAVSVFEHDPTTRR
jgi:chemotaxis protein CheX